MAELRPSLEQRQRLRPLGHPRAQCRQLQQQVGGFRRLIQTLILILTLTPINTL